MPQILQDPLYQEALLSIFTDYHIELEDILELATIENNGIRPDNLTNEIYSLFHHISRSLNDISNVKDAIDEVKNAKKTHLKRAILDSYKISINGVLQDESKVSDTLQDLILDEDFRSCVDDSVNKLHSIKELKKDIKKMYLAAKKSERKGLMDDAIKSYNKALEKANELEPFLDEFQTDKTYIVAIKRLKKKEKEKKDQKKFTIATIIISCVLTGVITFSINAFLIPHFCNQNNNTTQVLKESVTK